jgi:predicted ATP-grasp superfamily ATP-dependent carboligase
MPPSCKHADEFVVVPVIVIVTPVHGSGGVTEPSSLPQEKNTVENMKAIIRPVPKRFFILNSWF